MTHRPLVYLAGPIGGLSYTDARFTWRQEAKEILDGFNIGVLSPMRGKDALAGLNLDDSAALFATDPAVTSATSIMSRDENDVRRCDAVLLWLPPEAKPSIGTSMEIGMAHILRKPMIAVVGDDLENHPYVKHPMTQIAVGRFTNDLEKACAVIAHIVGEGI